MIRYLALLALLACALVPAAAGAAEPRFSMAEIESELMCPTCQTRLDLSHSPAADRIRAFVEAKRAQGWTKQEVKDALVRDFGPAVLAAPPAEGFGLVAWLVPIALVAAGVAVVVAVAVLWRRRRPPGASTAPVDPALVVPGSEARRQVQEDLQGAALRYAQQQRTAPEDPVTYVITEPCIDTKDKSCVDVCPVDCIHETDRMLVIDPEECIDCGACEPECPVEAIFPEDAVPVKWEGFVKINYAYAEGTDALNGLISDRVAAHPPEHLS